MGQLRQPPAARSPLGVAARVGIAIALGVALAIVIDMARVGSPAAWLARHGLAGLPGITAIAGGEAIAVDGRSILLDCRGRGSPTVILEAGMGDGIAGWAPVHDGLAGLTRTCAYDRAGRGRSDPRGRHTVADAAAELRTVLDAAGEAPPYIAVGHSLGEVYVRVFAAADPSSIAGLVLVDGFSADLEADRIHPLLGDLRSEYAGRLQGLRDLVARVEDLDWPASEAQLREADITGLPVEVLRAPRVEPRLAEATNRAISAAWEDAYRSLSPGLVRYELAWGAGHIVQADRPDLVIAAVGRLVDAARR